MTTGILMKDESFAVLMLPLEHSAILLTIGHEKHFFVFFKVAVLYRFYCIVNILPLCIGSNPVALHIKLNLTLKNKFFYSSIVLLIYFKLNFRIWKCRSFVHLTACLCFK